MRQANLVSQVDLSSEMRQANLVSQVDLSSEIFSVCNWQFSIAQRQIYNLLDMSFKFTSVEDSKV